jgi:hypothetical protein
MMKFRNIAISLPILLLMGALLTVIGCSLEAPDDPSALINAPGIEDAGARYVAIGNSLTAGYMDGGLMMAGQAYSYPNLIAGQLGLSRTQFTQPWIAAPGIGGVDGANVTGVLYFNGTTITALGSTPEGDVQSELLLAAAQPTQYHNLGVPGATLHDGMNAYSSTTCVSYLLDPEDENPFFNFINRPTLFLNHALTAANGVTYQSASQFSQAVAKGGALTTLWLGNNDVLAQATSGEPAAGFGNLNSAGALAFQADYTKLLSMLAGGLAVRNNGLKPTIVVANIPSVASTPFFIPKAVFDTYVASLPAGAWRGTYAESNVQYVLFTALTWLAEQPASEPYAPVPDDQTLDAAETTDVLTATAVFNGTIQAIVNAVNAADVANVGLVDMNAVLASRSDNEKRHFLFLRGAGMSVAAAAAATLFSLDGIHPNSHGQGVMANAFIDVINDLDGSSIAHVDPAALPWDPTYGVGPTKATGPLGLDARAAEAMTAIWR